MKTEKEARDAVKRLAELHTLLEKSQARVRRQRKLRPSEKAMTAMSYQQDIDAVQFAIDLIDEKFELKKERSISQ
jgi:hypothetical protein